ncbi:sensor histidine kinase [Robiginitomaculum antarcticum]|uniref:sensor histidine kinase n=1 Tax=Robiginitomaculum antarcticum TaxID=437507 RepID=UPI001F30F529|nr:PAS domain-containing protein [Robiginitomaculum antarcticum]
MAINKLRTREIFETIREGLLVLDQDLKVLFANSAFLKMFNVDAAHTAERKLYDLGNGQWDIPKLRTLLEEILPKQQTIESYIVEHEFEDIGRKVMELNARKTTRTGNGSLLILLAIEDVTTRYDALAQLDRQKRLAEGIVDTLREPLLVVDGDQIVIAASRSFYTKFEVDPAETIGRELLTLGNGQWNIPELTHLLDGVIPESQRIDDYEVKLDFPNIGQKILLLNARKIYREGNNSKTLLLAMEDITERRRLEAERDDLLKRANDLLEELNHRVMNSLTVVASIISMEGRTLSDADCKAAFDRMRTRIVAIGELYKNLTRMNSTHTVSANEYLSAIADQLSTSLLSDRKARVTFQKSLSPTIITTRIAVPLGLVLNELVTNAIKYAFDEDEAGEIIVALIETKGEILFSVSDNGKGVDENARVDSGVGGRLVKAFVQQLNGKMERQTGTDGTRYIMKFPYDSY